MNVVCCVFPAAASSAASGLGGALDRPAGRVRFNLLANPGPPQMGGAAAQPTGRGMIAGWLYSDGGGVGGTRSKGTDVKCGLYKPHSSDL